MMKVLMPEVNSAFHTVYFLSEHVSSFNGTSTLLRVCGPLLQNSNSEMQLQSGTMGLTI